MKKLCFGLLEADNYLRRHLPTWMAQSGGVITQEDLEEMVALEARKIYSACCPKAVIYPNHKALTESKQATYFGGGFFFNLEISTPRQEEALFFLNKALRRQKEIEVQSVTRYFRKHAGSIPVIVLIDPSHGILPNFKIPRESHTWIEQLRAVMVLSHRISRCVRIDYRTTAAGTASVLSHLLHAEEMPA